MKLPPDKFLSSLPLGYMISYAGDCVPENFMEVNGQRLRKEEYPLLFSVMVGSLDRDQDTFVLPTRERMMNYLGDKCDHTSKIIVKYR
jgi:Phage Tail Collar Domain